MEGAVSRLATLPEASGIAVSRRVPGRFWTHNDSGRPVLSILNERGQVTGQLELSGAALVDWEAVAVGSCPTGSCLYVGDIGDNDATRDHISVYRLSEPGDTVPAAASTEAFHGKYPDGAHDAETLLVAPDGAMYVVTKGSTGPVAIYRFPSDVRASAPPVELERIGLPRSSSKVSKDEWITDGAISADGGRVALRTHSAVYFYRTSQLLEGNWSEAQIISLKSVGEPQGEGVALGSDNAVYLTGEGGGKSQPGSFARLICDG
jgi:hypothetical protein